MHRNFPALGFDAEGSTLKLKRSAASVACSEFVYDGAPALPRHLADRGSIIKRLNLELTVSPNLKNQKKRSPEGAVSHCLLPSVRTQYFYRRPFYLHQHNAKNDLALRRLRFYIFATFCDFKTFLTILASSCKRVWHTMLARREMRARTGRDNGGNIQQGKIEQFCLEHSWHTSILRTLAERSSDA